jgi:hypothetical protein
VSFRSTAVTPAVLAATGAGVLLAWGALVLPAISLGLEPLPGKELQFLVLSVLPPAAASGLLLAGGLLGLRRRRRAGARFASPGFWVFFCVAAAGDFAAAFTLLVVRAVL